MKRTLIRTLRVVLPLTVLGGAALAAVGLISSRPPVATQPLRIEPPGVRVHEVTFEDVPLTVVSQGTVRPRNESQLVSQIAGRVMWVAPSFAEGGFFEPNDVLVRIDTFDYEQAIVSARSQLAQARLLLAQEEAEADVAIREWGELGRGDPRALTLREPQLEDARASVAAAEANLERAERDFERAQIVAPYAGRVRRKNVDVGQYVSVGAAIATIYAVDFAEVRLPLPDEELAYLDLPLSYRGVTRQSTPTVKLRAMFAGETHEWDGLIVRTESEIDPISRMVHVVAEVNDPYAAGPTPNRPPLAVGMYVQAEIEGRTVNNVAVVPRAALRGNSQVIVVGSDDRISFRDIDILRTTTQRMFVREGLTAGELVAVSPLDAATEGMRVQLANMDRDALVQGQAAAPEPARAAPREAAPAAPEARPVSVPVEAVARASAPAGPVTVPATPAATAPAAAAPSPQRAALSAPPAEPQPRTAEVPAAGSSERPDWLDALLTGRSTAQPDPRARRAAADRAAERAPAARRPIRSARADAASPAIGSAPPERARPAAALAAPSGRPVRPGPPPPLPPVREAPAAEARLVAADAPPGTEAPAAVAVAAFATLGTGPAGAGIGEALARAVAGSVADRGMRAVERPDTARFTIDGGVQQVGPAVRVTARITDTAGGGAVRAIKVDGTAEDLPGLRRDVVAAIGDGLAELWAAAPAAPTVGAAEPATQLARDFLRRRAASWRAPEPTARPPRSLLGPDRASPPVPASDESESIPEAVPSVGAVAGSSVAVLRFDELGASGNGVRGVSLGRVITDTVTARLAGLPTVTIVTPGEDAVWTVGGGIQRVGDAIRVTARVVDIASGAVVTSVKVDGTVAELADLQNRVAAAVTRGVADALAREMQVGADMTRISNGRRS